MVLFLFFHLRLLDLWFSTLAARLESTWGWGERAGTPPLESPGVIGIRLVSGEARGGGFAVSPGDSNMQPKQELLAAEVDQQSE